MEIHTSVHGGTAVVIAKLDFFYNGIVLIFARGTYVCRGLLSGHPGESLLGDVFPYPTVLFFIIRGDFHCLTVLVLFGNIFFSGS